MVKSCVTLWLIVLLSGVASIAVAQGGAFVDPMRPSQGPSMTSKSIKNETRNSAKPLQLQAVLVSKERSVAVINGQLLQQGELIDGYKVIRISSDTVILQGKSGKRTLSRAGTGLKKMSTKSDVKKGSKQ